MNHGETLTPDEIYVYEERLALSECYGAPTDDLYNLAMSDVRRFRKELKEQETKQMKGRK